MRTYSEYRYIVCKWCTPLLKAGVKQCKISVICMTEALCDCSVELAKNTGIIVAAVSES